MKGTSPAIEMTDEEIKEILARPIDYSDIPEMSEEEFYRCLIRLPNQPLDKGGAWHKPGRHEDLSEEARRKVEQMMKRSEDAETEARCYLAAKNKASAKLEAAACDRAAFK